MQIISASYNQFGDINVVLVDQPPDTTITVPTDPANKDYVELQEWAAKGNTIMAYEAPIVINEPTIEDRMAELESKVAALETKG